VAGFRTSARRTVSIRAQYILASALAPLAFGGEATASGHRLEVDCRLANIDGKVRAFASISPTVTAVSAAAR
jgi:hypothetical protein